MWSIVVLVVFPLLKSLVEGVRIVDDFTFEQSIELVGIDALRAFDFAFQSRGSGTDLDVSDAHVEQVSMKRRAEFLAVVRVDLLDLERQFREDVIDEFRSRTSDRCAWQVPIVGPDRSRVGPH